MLFRLVEREDQMNAPIPKCVFHPQTDQRANTRFPVTIPAITQSDALKRSATILNLTVEGAMIRTSSSLSLGSSVIINFGSTSVAAKVAWHRPDGDSGVKFERSLTNAELREQLARSAAVASLRAKSRLLFVSEARRDC
jgi:hypothetical protein